jgi:hypothetical protein
MKGVTAQVSRMDGATIRASLVAATHPPEVDESLLQKAVMVMCEAARRRTTINFSGALPGPPLEQPSLARRLVQVFEGAARKKEKE